MGDPLVQRLAGLLSEVCGAPLSAITTSAAPGVTPGWDSVANLGFIAAVEDDFGIAISTNEALAIKSLGDMVALVKRKGKA